MDACAGWGDSQTGKMRSPFDADSLQQQLAQITHHAYFPGVAGSSPAGGSGRGMKSASGARVTGQASAAMDLLGARQEHAQQYCMPNSREALQFVPNAHAAAVVGTQHRYLPRQQRELMALLQQNPGLHQQLGLSLEKPALPGAVHSAAQPDAPHQDTPSQQKPQGIAEGAKMGKCVPPLVEKLVPEAELYKRLLDMEELLERASAKQAWEIKDALRDRPSLLRTLRICVCNTHKNQFASRVPAADEEQASGEMGEESGPGAASRSQEKKGPQEWTLHILGDANGVEKDSQKLSDFIDKIEIEFPEESGQPDRKFLWNRGTGGQSQHEAASFDLTRSGPYCNKEFEISITIFCRSSPTKYLAVNPIFGEALGLTTASSKNDFIHAFWTYIKGKRLHDPHDISCIKLDSVLQSVLNVETFNMSQFSSILSRALKEAPPAPVHITHRLNLSSTELKPTVVDVTVSVASERAVPIHDYSETFDSVDGKLKDMMQEMATKKRRRDFMQACAESPVVFLNQMLESINSNVQELKRSYLMRLPHARLLCIGMGCKGEMQEELLEEERTSAMWDWSGSTRGIYNVLEKCEIQSRKAHMAEQHSSMNGNLQHAVETGGSHAMGAPASGDQGMQQQTTQKRQKKTDDLSGLDPSQALKDLMMRGSQSTATRLNSVNALPEYHPSAGYGRGLAPGERMNGVDSTRPDQLGLLASSSAPASAGSAAQGNLSEQYRQIEAKKSLLEKKEISIRTQLHEQVSWSVDAASNPAVAQAKAEEIDAMTHRLMKDEVQELQQEYTRITGMNMEWVWSKAKLQLLQQQQQADRLRQEERQHLQLQIQQQQQQLQMLAAQHQTEHGPKYTRESLKGLSDEEEKERQRIRQREYMTKDEKKRETSKPIENFRPALKIKQRSKMILDQKEEAETTANQGEKAPPLPEVKCGNACWTAKGVWCCRMKRGQGHLLGDIRRASRSMPGARSTIARSSACR